MLDASAPDQFEAACHEEIRQVCGNRQLRHYYFSSALLHRSNVIADTMCLDGMPRSWSENYHRRQYAGIDPALPYCKYHLSPYIWPQSMTGLSAQQQAFYKDASLHGICSGVSFPYRGFAGQLGIFTVTSEEPYHRSGLAQPELQYEMHLLGARLMEAHRQAVGMEPEAADQLLTGREKECVRWIADGKTAIEVGLILGISHRTAIFHLQNATTKMGTTSRTSAAVKAVLCEAL